MQCKRIGERAFVADLLSQIDGRPKIGRRKLDLVDVSAGDAQHEPVGDFDAADAEMARLAPYESGLDEKGQWELRNQRKGIAEMRVKGAPKQSVPLMSKAKIGRNAPCPCGSGKKFKKCHGRNK